MGPTVSATAPPPRRGSTDVPFFYSPSLGVAKRSEREADMYLKQTSGLGRIRHVFLHDVVLAHGRYLPVYWKPRHRSRHGGAVAHCVVTALL
jgi:hypothetical protein